MTAELEVRYEQRVVGRLRLDDAGRLCFRYDPSWLDAAATFAISVSLPKQAGEIAGGAAHGFFTNLLPEGLVRHRVARRLGISEHNDFELLRAIGGECAGALSIVEPAAGATAEPSYERLSPAQLEKLSDPGELIPLLVGGTGTRLSLAGAHDKLPVFVDGDKLYLPYGHAPTTHIIKVGSPAFAHLPANEAFTTSFAAALGLPVVETSLLTQTRRPLLLVRRFDRVVSDDDGWTVRRLHQEDFCQALGLRSTQKYEEEGGPSARACVELVRTHSLRPLVDTRQLLRWLAFNLLAGNADGHGKNLALLYEPAGPVLAPPYDLVCTRAYKTLDRHLAMAIGGESDPGQIARKHWHMLAVELEIAPRAAIAQLNELLAAADEALARCEREFRERYGAQPVLGLVPPVIRRQLRRTRTLLSQDG